MKMGISRRSIHIIKILLISVLLLVVRPANDNGHPHQTHTDNESCFYGKTLVCGIDLGDDMKGSHGLETGLAYEMMMTFADENNCNLSIMVGGNDVSYIDSLYQGEIDLLITHLEDIEGYEDIHISQKLTDCSVIAINGKNWRYVSKVNEWIDRYTQSDGYHKLQNQFCRQNDPIKLAAKGVRRATLSPYDDLLKQYASELGWDWRMLAAVVYQESKFSINSRSFRGATGLMQVMPQTGRTYNIDNLYDPENNLIAGTNHLKRLHGLYRDSGMTPEERIRFTLAAYNAGEGRIQDCRNFAKSKNYNHNSWAEVAKVIPMMNEDSILTDENVKLGKFKGTETLAYVDNVMTLYSAICKVCSEN